MAKRLRRVKVTPELIEDIVVKGLDLPDDARLLELWKPSADAENRVYTLVFESDEFEKVEEGAFIPEHGRERPDIKSQKAGMSL